MGDFTGDTRTNSIGRQIFNWMTANNLILWNERLTHGQPTSYTFQGTSIIDYFFSTVELLTPTLRIRDDVSLNSNHKFMTLSFSIQDTLTTLPPPPRITWNINKLKRPKYRGLYRKVFIEKLSLILPPHPSLAFPDRTSACNYIDHIHDHLCHTIISTLDAVCGRRSTHIDDYLRDFWTPEMTAAFARKEYLYKKWRKARGLNCLRYWEQHQAAQAALRRLITQRRRETWRLFCQQLEQGDYTKAIAKFSRIRKNRKIKATFSTTEGPQHSADVMAQHLQQIFAGDLLPNRSRSHPHTYTTQPFDLHSCPITIDSIKQAISELPRGKAPGVDHVTLEMLLPITDTLTPILLYTFKLCWQWSYTPPSWRVAQVLPIHKKGSVSDPANFRPISLTSTFRKILEKTLQLPLEEDGPPLDIAQGGFRHSRSTLDQALCLIETCAIMRRKHNINPTLAFLDIKSAYDSVDRNYIWDSLQSSLPPALLGLLRNLFDDVQIEVIVSNATSSRFKPTTGVLQGSILSPYLYSVYINQLPALLRDQPLNLAQPLEVCHFATSITSLLYADDVVLIADSNRLPTLLQQCEEHSQLLGYRWNPLKCAIVAPSSDTSTYFLYGTAIPSQSSFPYLGIPIGPGGHLLSNDLIQHNVNKALQTMNQMSAIGVNHKGFSPLLSVRFYSQIVRSQLEYGLAISAISPTQMKKLEDCQTKCIRRIFGGNSRSSTKVMLHLTNQPTMKERVHRLQGKYILRSLNGPEDTLLSQFLPYLRTSASISHWYKLSKTPVWQRCCTSSNIESLNIRQFNSIFKDFRLENLQKQRDATNSVLISACRPTLSVDPILWLPMSPAERSRLVRWRLGWLPGGVPKPCIYHPNDLFTRSHSIRCLHMHRRLQMPFTEPDPLSFLLNKLPAKKQQYGIASRRPDPHRFSASKIHPPGVPPLGTKFIAWLCKD
ncbi:hypothetical protein G6F22_008669 [Rhizopus arrhizus]|nr:hypothetical protein G6F22_008669 [Rhizopus arrhizus]